MLRSLFERSSSQLDVRAAMDSDIGYDAVLWRQLAEQIGVQGLALPEELGGAGYGDLELGIVLEEAGRALVCAPLFSTVVLAAKTLVRSENSAAQKSYLPRIAAGECIATLAWIDEAAGAAGDPSAPTPVTAREVDGSWRLDGVKLFVVDALAADLLLVSAQVGGEVALFALEAGSAGLERSPMSTLDLTRRQGRVTLNGARAELLVESGRAATVLARVLDEARVLLSLEQVGGTEYCLELAVEYAKIREQFGRPIGSFQAIKHRCADMLVELELAKSTAYNALWALAESTDDPDDDLALAASMAKALCSEAYVFVATENIQVHGGIGFSWEHVAHLYFRRARSSAVMLGDARFHRELIAQRLGV